MLWMTPESPRCRRSLLTIQNAATLSDTKNDLHAAFGIAKRFKIQSAKNSNLPVVFKILELIIVQTSGRLWGHN